jgi:6-pyruvoyltetrahydropterin/6-carboxytetrahydropterin synthase
MTYRLHVVTEPDRLYFAHMTVYPGGRKERLHGHNFQIFLDVELADGTFAKMVDLDVFRNALAEICAAWKERLLLPAASMHFEVVRDDGVEIDFRLCGKRYVVPRDEVVLVPIDNVSVEGLAEHVARRIAERVVDPTVRALDVRVEELPGIGASYRLVVAS